MPASILIIEDYSAHRELIRYLLEQYGHETCTAVTGEQAMEVLVGATPDLVLCDLHLGRGMDGYTVAEWARTQPRLAACPLLCITAFCEALDPGSRPALRLSHGHSEADQRGHVCGPDRVLPPRREAHGATAPPSLKHGAGTLPS
jgi:CheY-like chemotaxis protein